jgi:hypothetical protein
VVLKGSTSTSIVEALNEKIPDRAIVQAVEQLDRKRVSVADVATVAGVGLSVAERELVALAALSRANIAVSDDGELIYEFPNDLTAVLSTNSAKYQTMQRFRQYWPAIFYAIRVSFGVALLASVAAIFSAIFVLQTSSSSDREDRDDRRGGGGGGFGNMMYWWGPSPFDIFYYRPHYGYYGGSAAYSDPEEMGFLESVFSYVFGDGDPNNGIEERRLARAAAVIRDNQGAVTAEQLAPFCDDAPRPSDQSGTATVDEQYVLPIVSALGGKPEVTDDGEIVYVFSELQTSALSSSNASTGASPQSSALAVREARILKRAGIKSTATAREIARVLNNSGISTRGAQERSELIAIVEGVVGGSTGTGSDAAAADEVDDSDEAMLQEREWKFSLASDTNKFFAGGLGVLNLGGALYLGTQLKQLALYGSQLPSWLGLIQASYPFLVAYAVLFNAIPFARRWWIQQENSRIQERNQRRRMWRSSVKSATGRLLDKLTAAKNYRLKRKNLGASKTIYDTSKALEDVPSSKQQRDMEAFDKLLEQQQDSDASFQ